MAIEPAARRLIVSGVGFRAKDGHSVGNDLFHDAAVKPNIGCTVALEAARAGYSVVLIARTEAKLAAVCGSIQHDVPSADVTALPLDLNDLAATKAALQTLPTDREIDLVHCAGLGAGSYQLPDDNPYLAVDQTPLDLPLAEFQAVVGTLLATVQALLPRWHSQRQTRLVAVTSMSGVRALPFGYSHAAAKAGAHNAVRSLALELNHYGIRVSEVLPGLVDTGMYESPAVLAVGRKIMGAFGYSFGASLPTMTTLAVADAVLLCLRSDAHILSINLVAQGQFPHMGA